MEGTLGTIILIFFVILTCSGVSNAQEAPPPISESQLHKIASSLEMYVDELPQMPKLYGYSINNGEYKPGSLTVGMYETKWKFHRDFPATTVFAFGTSPAAATFPGPTIEAMHGVPLSVTWENHLPETHILPLDPTIPVATPKHGGVPTVVHLHGGIHPSTSDGHPYAWFTKDYRETGPNWTHPTYTYPNVQHSGNLWYHDHALGLTRVNLLAGLLGAYVIRDPALDSKLNLPSGPEYDRHLVVVDRSFYNDGWIFINRTGDNPTIHPQWQPEYFGDAIIVNGKAWPYLKVSKRKYRFRIINSSNARFFRFALSNGQSFIQVGSDASYLPAPVETKNILLAPAEIADVVIDFSKTKSKEIVLTNSAPYPFPSGSTPDSLNSKVMKFILKPEAQSPPDYSQVPSVLMPYTTPTIVKAARTRYIVLYEYDSATGNPTHLFINGKQFADPVTETPKSGTTEIWYVINLTNDNHPLHIHLATFQAIRVQEIKNLSAFTSCMTSKNDALACNITSHVVGKTLEIPAYEKTWKNTVKMVPGYQTTIVVQFNLVDNHSPYPFDATAGPGYVYHCHILDHEDNEMIRPLKLVA